MKKDLIIASSNKGKISEFKEMFPEFNVLPMSDFTSEEIEENGKTFEENAKIKAEFLKSKAGDFCVLADDSGLIVDALNGAPGIYTARYAGENATADQNMDKLLAALNGVKDRKARFSCTLCFIDEKGNVAVETGISEGEITTARKGTNGFGYNPIFYSYELKKTFGEADENERNEISHRGRAVKKLKENPVFISAIKNR